MQVTKFETLDSKLINLRDTFVLVDSDVADLFGVETRDINKAVKNNPSKFPKGYLIKLDRKEKNELIENFQRFNKLKHSTALPKALTEKGLYMIATILKSKVATEATLQIIETFAKIKALSRNINEIMKIKDESIQKELSDKSNRILENIIDIDMTILEDDNDDKDGEIIETTTKFEFNLGFAKVSRSVKKITNDKKKIEV
ncbi:MAG: ORF6N domain-containing protein [Psychromonas sp.]|nr:ORF6N domain-containing protein [Psychromonas sp.]